MSSERIGAVKYKNRTYFINYDIFYAVFRYNSYVSGKYYEKFQVSFYIHRESIKNDENICIMVLDGNGNLHFFEPNIIIPLLRELIWREIQKYASDLIWLHNKKMNIDIKLTSIRYICHSINDKEQLYILKALRSPLGNKKKRIALLNYYINEYYQPMIRRNIKNVLAKRKRLYLLDDSNRTFYVTLQRD